MPNPNPDDTIAAIATAPGEAGISIVRVSGPECFKVADEIFECTGDRPSEREGGTFVHGGVRDQDGVVDDALLLIMRAPRSYTREDCVEIQGHGGNTTSRRILRCALDAGARLAEPGEFTKRAFLSGRIDLLQAEAVLDLIKARTDRAADAALEQLEGALSKKFDAIYDEVLAIAADLEATLDFPEDELPAPVMDDIRSRLASASARNDALITTWDEGHLLRDGARVVIAGQPNVGKSTLLNALLESDRAIVSDMPGTTRDSIEEALNLDGIPLRVIDTAGLRDTDDTVEREGIRRTRVHIENADLHLYVVDASQPLTHADRNNLTVLDPMETIVVLNKIDLGSEVNQRSLISFTCIETQLNQGLGLDLLRKAMAAKLEGDTDFSVPAHAVISERHRRLLLAAQKDIQEASALLAEHREDTVPLSATRLRAALESIGSATGRHYENDLLDSIFSRFCIGK